MRISEFDYELPEELIAARPPAVREGSRMMIVDRGAGTIAHRQFADFPGLLEAGDLLVLNDTRVVAARYFSDDGKVELLRTGDLGECRWKCMVKPGKRMKEGRELTVGGVRGRVTGICEDGERIIEFDDRIDEDAHGHLALPHYIGRSDDAADRERYQTVYANTPGAIAAPTAGLHFTNEILKRINHAFVTLHVGVGTFRPVKAESVEDHRMHLERYEVSEATAKRIAAARRIAAVGTTTARVLEHSARSSGVVGPGSGETDIFIYPPYEFRAVDMLLTNFHLPKSTLLMMVSAFGGLEVIREAYAEAVREKYRFYSYGDCMVIV